MITDQMWTCFCEQESEETIIFVAVQILRLTPTRSTAELGLALTYLTEYVISLRLNWQTSTCREVFELLHYLKVTDPISVQNLVNSARNYLRLAAEKRADLVLGVKYL